jgi:PAS domain S-box-containing protein
MTPGEPSGIRLAGRKDKDENMNKLLRLEESLNEMAAVAKHIAELKVQMKELRTREKQLRTLVENLPQRLYLRDRNSVYIFCNAPYAADLKMKAEDIAGKSVFEFFPEELAEEYAAEDKRIIETGRREEREEEYLAREDTLIVHALKIPVRDETGQITGVLGIFTDMTGLKRKENPGSEKAVVSLPGRDEGSLQESQEKFQTMVGNSDRKSKEHLISMFARLLQTDMNLDFLLKLESAELQNLTALTRDRVDQKTT